MLPSIDLLKGRAVRLRKGRASEATVYSEDPVALAKSWSTTHLDGIHVVDLDGAFNQGNNLHMIKQITQATETPIQVGGGIRTATIARELLDADVDTLVVGTVALTDESAFGKIMKMATPSRIVVALDYRDENVLIAGWRQLSGIKLDKALEHLLRTGISDFLLTCAERDGMMDGPDIDTISRICKHYAEARIFASGGVRSTVDIAALRDAGAYAAIVGKAILEETLAISDAIEAGTD